MKPGNLLIIMADEHNPKVLGCAGHRRARTPALDALASGGTRFAAACTPSPVCVPARAASATGQPMHRIGFWDNADAYDGSVPSWHHRLREAGHRVVSIGKLHFRGHPGDDHGFSEEIVPMHILDGRGDLMGLVRDDLPERGMSWKIAELAGPGESSYTAYDRDIATRAQVWLREQGARRDDKPWALFVSFVSPHFPLIAPAQHYYRFPVDDMPLPKLYAREQRPDHPYVRDYAGSFAYDRWFDPAKVRRATAAYLGLVSFVDDLVAQVLRALEEAGLAGATRVVYTSDHGDNLGARGLWGKSTMYEEAVGVPLIVSGPDVPRGRVVGTPASLLDVFPTALQAVGCAPADPAEGHPGRSLLELAREPDHDRSVLAEYHGMGSTTAAFMLRDRRWKYVHYVRYRPQLFDLANDPEELRDLAEDPAYAEVLAACRARLMRICDPDEVDRRCRARQAELLAANGGRDAVIRRGDLGFTPAPGWAASFG